MDGARGIEKISASARGVQRAGDFLANVRRLARAGDADSSWTAMDHVNGAQERRIEAIGHVLERIGFAAYDLPGVAEPIVHGVNLQRHGASLPRLVVAKPSSL